jgi:farnesyl-diphosphate farnesyltransferase
MDDFVFMTRVRYWAADTVTHGPAAPWGENEIDYILFTIVPDSSTLSLSPHPDEVQDTKWVSSAELEQMLSNSSLLFSPWFRIICSKWLLHQWWPNLDQIFIKSTGNNPLCDYDTIHAFDPPEEHYGGAGNAQPRFGGIPLRENGNTITSDTSDIIAERVSLPDEISSDNIIVSSVPLEFPIKDTTRQIIFTSTSDENMRDVAVTDVEAQPTLIVDEVAVSTSGHLNGRHADTNGNVGKKQGAYGKVPIHSESKIRQIMHINETWAALTLLYIQPLQSNVESAMKYAPSALPDDIRFCQDILVDVSRSFAAVIQQLPASMLLDVCVFYLVLRALDTIEDDTTAFESQDSKIEHLRSFHQKALIDPTWSLNGIGEGSERKLLQEFSKCHRVYKALPIASQQIIADITQRMADGMAEFVSKDLGQGTTDLLEYNRYCHYVAGLVGEGLSRLFSASQLEDPSVGEDRELSNQMGLFLQKTNIIRDYLEDYVDQRAFWPQSVWTRYSKSGELGYFTEAGNQGDVRDAALSCLNELVTDALELVPDCLTYLSKLHCKEIFRFCAIPQVMAMATLAKCYGNVDVFTGVVKIRKGLSCHLILQTNNLAQVHGTFFQLATDIVHKANQTRKRNGVHDDPIHDRTVQACNSILERTKSLSGIQNGIVVRQRLTAFSVPLVTVWAWRMIGTIDSNKSNKSTNSSSHGPWPPVILTAVARLGVLGAAYTLYHWGTRNGSGRYVSLDSSPILRPAHELEAQKHLLVEQK